jgi:hypothetical protein
MAQATVIMSISYDHKIFIAQATEQGISHDIQNTLCSS